MVDDLSDFSKGQAFERFHCYKQVYIVIACNVCILFIPFFYFCLRSCLLYFLYVCIFDATILVNKDVYIVLNVA